MRLRRAPSRATTRELVLIGVFRYANTWPTAIGLASSGTVDLDAMVTMVTGHLRQTEVDAALRSVFEPGVLKSAVATAQ